MATQYGPNLHLPSKEGGTPRFWEFVTRGEWQKALEEFRDFGDGFQPRRDKEANKLLEAFPYLKAPGKRSKRQETMSVAIMADSTIRG
ncbi:hypothetical protein JCM17844_06980 [Iodidimonas gelatinilytica]|uniref:Uncharacterized protein n=1 Tax=Iodidimonas gelatinilytica TaxID=1236966 RepID=A0A5A7MM57_9PROT|nr:hypothetical protein JCM17844_06980 [Iodidimonas gelatinilytica]